MVTLPIPSINAELIFYRSKSLLAQMSSRVSLIESGLTVELQYLLHRSNLRVYRDILYLIRCGESN